MGVGCGRFRRALKKQSSAQVINPPSLTLTLSTLEYSYHYSTNPPLVGVITYKTLPIPCLSQQEESNVQSGFPSLIQVEKSSAVFTVASYFNINNTYRNTCPKPSINTHSTNKGSNAEVSIMGALWEKIILREGDDFLFGVVNIDLDMQMLLLHHQGEGLLWRDAVYNLIWELRKKEKNLEEWCVEMVISHVVSASIYQFSVTLCVISLSFSHYVVWGSKCGRTLCSSFHNSHHTLLLQFLLSVSFLLFLSHFFSLSHFLSFSDCNYPSITHVIRVGNKSISWLKRVVIWDIIYWGWMRRPHGKREARPQVYRGRILVGMRALRAQYEQGGIFDSEEENLLNYKCSILLIFKSYYLFTKPAQTFHHSKIVSPVDLAEQFPRVFRMPRTTQQPHSQTHKSSRPWQLNKAPPHRGCLLGIQLKSVLQVSPSSTFAISSSMTIGHMGSALFSFFFLRKKGRACLVVARTTRHLILFPTDKPFYISSLPIHRADCFPLFPSKAAYSGSHVELRFNHPSVFLLCSSTRLPNSSCIVSTSVVSPCNYSCQSVYQSFSFSWKARNMSFGSFEPYRHGDCVLLLGWTALTGDQPNCCFNLSSGADYLSTWLAGRSLPTWLAGRSLPTWLAGRSLPTWLAGRLASLLSSSLPAGKTLESALTSDRLKSISCLLTSQAWPSKMIGWWCLAGKCSSDIYRHDIHCKKKRLSDPSDEETWPATFAERVWSYVGETRPSPMSLCSLSSYIMVPLNGLHLKNSDLLIFPVFPNRGGRITWHKTAQFKMIADGL
ncbi:hypothetical protein VP01_1562g2 [Puccinia sorghi]|uniref:Uncharacterized protein n=1 Tax=Puccinia sorghi TaxID=27349 RepID=A0A0L6VI07_9BASI|nr:hypothetical protein VP01_1562g2 [Puccinia sorghi]